MGGMVKAADDDEDERGSMSVSTSAGLMLYKPGDKKHRKTQTHFEQAIYSVIHSKLMTAARTTKTHRDICQVPVTLYQYDRFIRNTLTHLILLTKFYLIKQV